MSNFFDRMLGRSNKEGSSAVAKNRLQVVLVHDRINLPPERLREMEAEILAVIARYVPVDPGDIVIMLEQPDRNSGRLVAQIPFGKGRPPAENVMDHYTEDDDLEGDSAASKGTEAAPDADQPSSTDQDAQASTGQPEASQQPTVQDDTEDDDTTPRQ